MSDLTGIRPADLRPGLAVAVSDSMDGRQAGEWSPWGQPSQQVSYTGVPLRIIAVSLPFVCATDGHHNISIDTRTHGFVRLRPSYVRAMKARPKPVIVQKPRKKKRKPDPRQCPQCGNRCVEFLAEPGVGVWKLLCKQCGWSGEQEMEVVKI